MDITVNFKGGGSFVKIPPVFSKSGERIFLSCKSSIIEYSTKTGKLIYEYKVNAGHIVGFGCHLFNNFECLSVCTNSSKLILWKISTHFKVFEKKLPYKTVSTYNVVQGETECKILISYKSKNRDMFAVYDVDSNEAKKYKLKLTSDSQKLSIAASSSFFSVTQDNNVYFMKFDNYSVVSRCSIEQSKTFTCVACHPAEEMVLTGDTLGRVILWQNIFQKRKIQHVFHWHTLPVQTVTFSTSGTYFYSGGEECVLVKWQLEDLNDRKFVPRLGAEISHVCIAKDYLAVSTRNNAIRILDHSLNEVTLIQHLNFGKHSKSGIAYDFNSKSLILNGNEGHLQFYSPIDMTLMYTLDMVGQNKITNERDCPIINTEIIKIDISNCGLWLTTAEERKDGEFNEVRLKFWKFDQTKQMFELNTCIEYPHSSSINCMQFQPSNKNGDLLFVTIGNDKQFKVWHLIECNTVYKKSFQWEYYAVGFYRNMECNSLSFSVDGSLMAVGFASLLTVWLPETCRLKCSLVHPLYKEKITQVQFGYGNQCHLLVAASQGQLNVWNLLTLSLVWVAPMSVAFLVADPLSTNMAVITVDSRVFVFCPASPSPIYCSDDLLKRYNIVAAKFVPSKDSNDARRKWFERTQIYFVTSTNELYCISSNELKFDPIEVDEEKESLYASSLPLVEINPNQSVKPTIHLFEKDAGHKSIKKYLDAPLHTMAPIRFSCHGLIRSLVIQKAPT